MTRYVSALLVVMAMWAASGALVVMAIWAFANSPLWISMAFGAGFSAVGGLYWGAAFLNRGE